MVAIIDPNGTPQPVYTRGGVTIQTVIATGTTFGGAAQIVAPSGYSVVIADCTDNTDTGVILPDDAQVGDVVEVYPVDYFAKVYAPDGEGIAENDFVQVGDNEGVRLRKVSATLWRYF